MHVNTTSKNIQKGFSLTEVMIAISILTISMLANTKVISHSLTNLYQQQQGLHADLFAAHLSELITLHPSPLQDLKSNIPSTPLPCANAMQMRQMPACLPSYMRLSLNDMTVSLESFNHHVVKLVLKFKDNSRRDYLIALNHA